MRTLLAPGLARELVDHAPPGAEADGWAAPSPLWAAC
eukprot:SAG22_NODE_4931_length_1128_cov_1.237123_1_plen_36_part_10